MKRALNWEQTERRYCWENAYGQGGSENYFCGEIIIPHTDVPRQRARGDSVVELILGNVAAKKFRIQFSKIETITPQTVAN